MQANKQHNYLDRWSYNNRTNFSIRYTKYYWCGHYSCSNHCRSWLCNWYSCKNLFQSFEKKEQSYEPKYAIIQKTLDDFRQLFTTSQKDNHLDEKEYHRFVNMYENYRVASQSQNITNKCAKLRAQLRDTTTPTTTLTSHMPSHKP